MRKHETQRTYKTVQNCLTFFDVGFPTDFPRCKDEGGPYQPYVLHGSHSSLRMLPQVLQPSGCGQH